MNNIYLFVFDLDLMLVFSTNSYRYVNRKTLNNNFFYIKIFSLRKTQLLQTFRFSTGIVEQLKRKLSYIQIVNFLFDGNLTQTQFFVTHFISGPQVTTHEKEKKR